MYDEAQQPAGEQVDSLLQEEFQRRHLAQHDRSHLEECTEEEFEADLCDFLRQNQEPTLAKAVADHRITWYVLTAHNVSSLHYSRFPLWLFACLVAASASSSIVKCWQVH